MKMERHVKEALKRLVREASESPKGTLSLEGDEGFSAKLQESEVGQARLVRVFREGDELYWSFVVQRDEPKPQFYPEEIPYLPSAFCMLHWHRRSGLAATWTPGSGEEAEGYMAEVARKLQELEMPEGVEETLKDMRTVGKQTAAGLKEGLESILPKPFLDRISELAQGILPRELPDEATELSDAIAAFLEDRGWILEGEPDQSRISLSKSYQRDGSFRELKVFSMMGISSVGLWTRRPTANEGEKT